MDVKMFTSVFCGMLLSGLYQSHRLLSMDGIGVMLIIGIALYGAKKKDHSPGGS